MKELDKNEVYSLEDLKSDELQELLTWLKNNDKYWFDCTFEEMIEYKKNYMLVFGDHRWYWKNAIEPTTNAKELFEPEYEVKYIAEVPKEDKPKHYAKGIDTFERMEANCTLEECLAFAKGNIDKYNFRTKSQDLEDYTKIIAYANWAIKLLNKKENE